MSIPEIQAVPWVEQPPEGAIDTPSEAIADWMNKNNITDLTKLSSAQIKSLISHLKGLQASGNIPGLSSLINTLENIQRDYADVKGTDLEKYAAGLKMQVEVLTELGKATGGTSNPFTAAAEAFSDQIIAIDKLIKDIDATASKWANDPTAMKAQITGLISQIQALKAAGVPTGELGLDSLAADLQSALDTYNAEMAGVTDPNSTQAKLALSNLREAFHQAKLQYFSSTEADPNNPGLAGARAGIRSEELRQTSLLSPYEDTTASPTNVSIEDIDQAMVDLDLQYQMAAAEGNKDAMAHIEAKMEILTRARNMLAEGQDPLLVGVVLFIGLRMLDIASKKVTQARLREQAVELQKKNDPNLEQQIADITAQADALDAEIDALTKQVSQVQEQYESVLNTWTQNTNEALSKAL